MAGSPQEVLAAELRRLHRSAGEPGTRVIAKAIEFSHTTVAKALNGSRCPKWNAIQAIVLHLDGDIETFRPLWQAVRDAESPIPAPADILPTSQVSGETGNHALDARIKASYNDAATKMNALTEMGVLGIFTASQPASVEVSRILGDRSLLEVRLLGVSLSSWFGSRERHRDADGPGRLLERRLLGQYPDSASSGDIRVRVLLLDPACLGLRQLAHAADGDAGEELERLRYEIRETAEHLSRLASDVSQQRNGNSLQWRFSRAVPPFSLFATEHDAFVRPYYYGLTAEPRTSAWHFSGASSTYQAACRHFDVIWDTDFVHGDDLLRHSSIGTDQGIDESGIVNIYTDLESAQERIGWLIGHAKNRVWVQGVSLIHHLSPPLEEVMLSLMRRSSVKTRVLILDPDSDQAIRKSYRDHLLDKGDGTAVDYATYSQDEFRHTTSLVYEQLKYSAQRFARLSAHAPAENFQVRQYACAPTSYILVADDHALIEQFHYGKTVAAEASIQTQLQLAREMPLIEYTRPGSSLFIPKPRFSPISVIENHFRQVFEHFGVPVAFT